jgi:hypothetical protein
MTGMSLVTVVSSLALLKWYPQTNKFWTQRLLPAGKRIRLTRLYIYLVDT